MARIDKPFFALKLKPILNHGLIKASALAVVVSTVQLPLAADTLAQTQTRQECEAAQAANKAKRRRRPGGRVDCSQLPDANEQIVETVIDGKPQRRTPGPVNDARLKEEQTFTVLREDVEESPVPRPKVSDFEDSIVFPDRWRIVEAIGYTDNWWDPYNRNTLKGDVPLHDDWFFNLGVISDTIYEGRKVVTPVGLITTSDPGDLDLYGNTEQHSVIQQVAMEFVYYKGDTVFRPPDYEFRFIPVFNYNHTVVNELAGINVDPQRGVRRDDNFVGIQGAFIDVHLRNVSDNYDFDSIRVGIQPFNNDFRGFLFQDNQLGVRLFGIRNNNKIQYNLAWFRRLEKDTNSGLNDIGEAPREDDVFIANVIWQDLIALGHFSQFSIVHNRNREDEFFYDVNDLIQRPASLGFERFRNYDVSYLGFSSDGHFGRINVTHSLYAALGEQNRGPFVNQRTDIRSFFAAAEVGADYDWIRLRGSALWASGDDNPFDNEENGFDAIFENPQFAGADTSYWLRQGVPLAAGGKVTLSTRNGLLNNLRASKEHGQSNFTNPGVRLLGVGADFDILPELRASVNVNQLWFDQTEVLEVARQQADIDESIGTDVSLSLIYRPFMSQNVVVRLSYAALLPGKGFEQLFGDETQHSLLFNLVLTY
ncbi:hypothetical protein [uncultured Pseudoteredinibacter sp.]|uniref:hypothetical protein n=1 Tax=uncultured Pseudoteredinibacter sp. TaxID=1641701 RepID=UPI002637FA8A|nr:hypothetical protein [uncultured Pseudoteredinibacter sp.]